MKAKIILDTNFLLIPFTLKVDIFSEIDKIITFPYEFVVLNQTIDELNKIISNKKEKGKNREAAKLALKLIEKKNVKIINIMRKNIKKEVINAKKEKNNIKEKNLNEIDTNLNKIDKFKNIKQKTLYKDIIFKNNINLDDIIFDYAVKNIGKKEIIVATQDSFLRKRLAEVNIKTIYLRNKKYMEMQNVL